MPTQPVGVTDLANASGVVEVDVVERASTDLTTTSTADPGAAGTTLAVTSAAKFPASGQYKVRVEDEVMLVTAGQGTTSWTVTRAQDNTTGVAHASGVTVARVVAVQRVEPVAASRQTSYLGRACSFRIIGRAGTTHNLFAIHNATASKVRVVVNRIKVDQMSTVVKAVTVKQPQIRLYRFTALPTNGSSITKAPRDSRLSSSASVTLWQDASADGTLSATQLAITKTTLIDEIFAPRLISAAGYEMVDIAQFLVGEPDVDLGPLEGLAVILEDAVVTTGDPATDYWLVICDWEEYSVA